jgi:hypothetical protein
VANIDEFVVVFFVFEHHHWFGSSSGSGSGSTSSGDGACTPRLNTSSSIKGKSAWAPANLSRLKASFQYAVDGAPSLVVMPPK